MWTSDELIAQNFEGVSDRGYYESDELAGTHDPGGPDLQKRQAWLDQAAVKECKARGLGKVVHGRGWSCTGSRDPCEVCRIYEVRRSEWFDHGELFWDPEGREYVFTAQPYNVSDTDYRDMRRFAERHGLTVEISVGDAWWYPGRTPLIVWRRAR